MKKHLTTDDFVEKFYSSERGKKIIDQLDAPINADIEFVKKIAANKYANSSFVSLKLLARRELLLWWRDKYQIKAKIGQSEWRGRARLCAIQLRYCSNGLFVLSL